jgi:hypothetical protein
MVIHFFIPPQVFWFCSGMLVTFLLVIALAVFLNSRRKGKSNGG